jgi:hypothetical protein
LKHSLLTSVSMFMDRYSFIALYLFFGVIGVKLGTNIGCV